MSHTPSHTSDRYRSFKDIDVDGQVQRVMQRIEHHTQPHANPFWTYFHERRQARSGPRHDDLLLLASFVNPIRDLFEAQDDTQALEWLDQLENECF